MSAEAMQTAASCYVIAKVFTKLNANEALLAGLLSVIGRLYILLKSREAGIEDDEELEQVLADWHPAISKAIAESWKMSAELIDALESQLETDPPLQEQATLTEVPCAARLLLQSMGSSDPLVASEYPLLQRLGIADYGEDAVTLSAHAEETG